MLACPGNSPGVQDIDCTAAAAACAAPDERLYLAWARTVRRVDGTTLTPWRSSSTTMCIAPGRVPAAGGAAGAIDIAALVSSEFQRLPVPAPQPALQPAGRTLVNLATILYDTGPQTGQWDLTLVGTDVAVRAHPTQWRWSAPRGPVTTATTAGRPYPAKDVTITFTNPGATTLTLTTTWTGEFTVAGGAWQPIDGVVTRTATIPIDVVEARPQLVDSPRA